MPKQLFSQSILFCLATLGINITVPFSLFIAGEIPLLFRVLLSLCILLLIPISTWLFYQLLCLHQGFEKKSFSLREVNFFKKLSSYMGLLSLVGLVLFFFTHDVIQSNIARIFGVGLCVFLLNRGSLKIFLSQHKV